MRNKKVYSLVAAALIAAMYAVLTFVVAQFAYGAVQLRVSEALTILPMYTPVAVPGLTVGCLLANVIGLSLGKTVVWDLLFGTAASLIAAVMTYSLGKSKSRRVRYILGPFPAVLVNAVIVGMEITFFFSEGGATAAIFWANFASVFLGQAIICYGFGVPLMLVLERGELYKRIFKR